GGSGPCEQNENELADVKALLSRRGVLSLASRDDFQDAAGQRTLERRRLRRRRPQPSVYLIGRREDYRHGLGVDRRHFRVRLRREERKEVCGDLALPVSPSCQTFIIGLTTGDKCRPYLRDRHGKDPLFLDLP